MENNLGDWLTEQEAQKLTGVKRVKLYYLRIEGEIEFSKIGRKVFYSKQSIVDYLERNRI